MSESKIPTMESLERRIADLEAELKDHRALRTWLKKRPKRNAQPLLDAIEEKENES